MPTETADPKAAAGLKGGVAQTMNAIRDEIRKQDRVKLMIPRPQHIKKGMHHSIPVTINEYTFKVPTGVWVDLPEEVYLILVRSGQVAPQREVDQNEVPAFITQEGPEYDRMSGAGSMGAPVMVG